MVCLNVALECVSATITIRLHSEIDKLRSNNFIIRVGTIKCAKPAKCALSVILRLGSLSANQMCGMQMKLLTDHELV